MTRASSLAVFLLLVSAREARAASVAQDCSGTTFFVSAAAVTGLAVFDIATAPGSARRYNRQNLVVVPRLDPRSGTYGFSASLSFGRSSRAAAAGSFAAPVRKSPGTAAVLSLASTAGPMLGGLAIQQGVGAGLFLSGLVIGPSVGHFYAGQVGRGLATTGLRAAVTAAGLWSLISCID